MLPTPSSTVKSDTRQLLKEQAIIWAAILVPCLLLWLTGADAALVRAVYHPHFGEVGDNWAWFLRQYAAVPTVTLSVLGLGAMLWPKLWKTRPVLYKAALVMALTTILGAGVFNQILVKNLADRPRPRESVLMDQPVGQFTDSFRGNSMPSGHAAMGFALAAPFFPLRRRFPRTAAIFLTGGITLGLVVGLSRMVLGAHFLSDVLVAAALCLSTASLLHWLLERYQRFSHTLLGLLVVVLGVIAILGNRFSNQTFNLEITQPFTTVQLPCEVQTLPTPGQMVPTLTVKLHGYGGPRSNIELVQQDTTIKLITWKGFFHHLGCTATLAVPENE